MLGPLSFNTLQIFNWIIIATLASLFVVFMFIQAGLSVASEIEKTKEGKRLLLKLYGGKWYFTIIIFTLLASAFYFAFPFFFKVSFSGIPLIWFSGPSLFIVQGIIYIIYSKRSTPGENSILYKLIIVTGNLGVFIAGLSFGTFFTGSGFMITTVLDSGREIIVTDINTSALGFEAFLNITNILAGLMLLFLSRTFSLVYSNSIVNEEIRLRIRKSLKWNSLIFTIFFIAFFTDIFLKKGCAFMPDTGLVFFEKHKYFRNLIEMPLVGITFLSGIFLIFYSFVGSVYKTNRIIVLTGVSGIALLVFALFMNIGFNHTAFYFSTFDFQSAVSVKNGSADLETLTKVSYGSILLTATAIFIILAWRKKI